MTAAAQPFTDERVELAGAQIQLISGGTGDPVLVLHEEIGQHAWLRWHEEAAARNRLLIPSHPGFGESERLEWIMTVRDLAGWYMHALDDLGLDRVPVVGFSMGGWLAAEMAAMEPRRFSRLALVAPMGIRPPEGEIIDMFLMVARDYIEAGYLNRDALPEYQEVFGGDPTPERKEAYELAREQACRLAWRPYMYDPGLPYLLPRLKNTPTLVVWGKQDGVIPAGTASRWQQSIPGARVELIDQCGHHPEIEQREQFSALLEGFLAGT